MNQDELDRINKIKETNDKLEEFFNDKRLEWNDSVSPLFKVISSDLMNVSGSKQILDVQGLALSFRQQISEQINFFLNKEVVNQLKLKS